MASPKKAIVVGTSLEPPSDAVVRTGAQIARRWNAELHLFHAYSLPVATFAAPAGFATLPPNLLESESRVRRQMLDEQLLRSDIDRRAVTSVVLTAGAAHRMLLESAHELAADLIVIGANETSSHHLRGKTADRVLRKATCPVWITAGEPQLPPRRLLAPVDLSPLSEESLRRGLELLDQLAACEETTLDTLFVLTDEEHQSSTQFTPDQIERLAHEELARFAERLAPATQHPVRRSVVRIGDVRKEIMREVEQASIDLLLLGTHGRSGFERFFLGSVASDLASHAACHTLIIPPGAAAEEAAQEALRKPQSAAV